MAKNATVEDSGHTSPTQDTFDRQAGIRARMRREELGLSRQALATLSGISGFVLRRGETRGIPRYLADRERQAWEKALNVPAGWLLELDEMAVPGDPYAEAGQRANARREMLGITRRAVAAYLGISIRTLANWERIGAPSRIKGAQIVAWERALKVAPGWLLGTESSAAESVEKTLLRSMAPDASSAILEIVKCIATARFETFAPGEVRDDKVRVSATILSQRYGGDPTVRMSLAAIAERHGIVESRVSQILKALNTTAQRFNIEASAFERIRAKAKLHLPCPLHELEVVLHPLLGGGLAVETVNRFSTDILGSPLFAFAKRQVNGRLESFATTPEAGDSVADVSTHDTAIVAMAHAMIRVAGVAHMGLLKTYATEQGWATDVIAKIAAVVERTMGFEWLDASERDKPQWFWFRGRATERNVILEATRRVLAVATGDIALSEILGAIDRLRAIRAKHAVFSSMFDVQPPTRIVWRLLQLQTWLAVLGPEERIRSLQKIEPQNVLPPSEQVVHDALCEAGGVATRAWLFARVVKNGRMDEASFRTALLYAPSIARPYQGLYGVCGSQPDPDVLRQALRETPARTSSLWPVELDPQTGRAVFHQVINDWHLRGGWVTLPAAISAHVPKGCYSVHPDGDEVEVCSSGRAAIIIKGVASILRARGVGISDVIRLTFDLKANRLLVDFLPQNELARPHVSDDARTLLK
ncbi:helix-turn-helix domain-containing protein [Paraburkholderia tropica]|uniref:helix-turn-helix domain-containing protein n=1 Tax=Paraburkholderia tropica TaxID=92647 RepID=UPI002AB668A3|nr:helix-turn-helix domain-containing protein [Paraburkholderia tropica]